MYFLQFFARNPKIQVSKRLDHFEFLVLLPTNLDLQITRLEDQIFCTPELASSDQMSKAVSHFIIFNYLINIHLYLHQQSCLVFELADSKKSISSNCLNIRGLRLPTAVKGLSRVDKQQTEDKNKDSRQFNYLRC